VSDPIAVFFVVCFVGAVLGAIVFTQVARKYPTPTARKAFAADEAIELDVVGGALWSCLGMPWRVTVPSVRFQVLAAGLRIRPNGPLSALLVPRWEFAWKDVARIETHTASIDIFPKQGADRLRFLQVGSLSPRLVVTLAENRSLSPPPRPGTRSGNRARADRNRRILFGIRGLTKVIRAR